MSCHSDAGVKYFEKSCLSLINEISERNYRGTLFSRYNMLLESISPNKGSLTGGTEVTIKGNGFGNSIKDCSVLLGNATCNVKSINMSTIVCVTTGHVAANVTVNVSFIWLYNTLSYS